MPSIQDNGHQVLEMDMDLKCGQMAPDMREAGKMIKQMDKVSLCMQMVIFMKGNG